MMMMSGGSRTTNDVTEDDDEDDARVRVDKSAVEHDPCRVRESERCTRSDWKANKMRR
jgi:hypothetical protein